MGPSSVLTAFSKGSSRWVHRKWVSGKTWVDGPPRRGSGLGPGRGGSVGRYGRRRDQGETGGTGETLV